MSHDCCTWSTRSRIKSVASFWCISLRCDAVSYDRTQRLRGTCCPHLPRQSLDNANKCLRNAGSKQTTLPRMHGHDFPKFLRIIQKRTKHTMTTKGSLLAVISRHFRWRESPSSIQARYWTTVRRNFMAFTSVHWLLKFKKIPINALYYNIKFL
jgi:hypothetical protein